MITNKIINDTLEMLKAYAYHTDRMVFAFRNENGEQRISCGYEFDSIKMIDNKIYCEGKEVVISKECVYFDYAEFYIGKEMWLKKDIDEFCDKLTFTGELVLEVTID